MAILPIRLFGDPVLREKGKPVTAFGDGLRRVTDDMVETMYAAKGAGLAAPQVGLQLRLFVYDVGEGPEVAVNPELSEHEGTWTYEEGCLSLPGVYLEIDRPKVVRCRFQDVDGEPHEIVADELLARVFLHETDHCDGTFFTERASKPLRREAMRQMRERIPAGMREYLPSPDSPRAGLEVDGHTVL